MLKNTDTAEIELLKESQLANIFLSGIKSANIMSQKNVGIEFEKLPVTNTSYKALSYIEVSKFLNKYENKDYNKIKENGAILGLKSDIGLISLEPGSQTELSLNPTSNLLEAKKQIEIYNKKTATIADGLGFCWLGYGIQPVSTCKNINIIPKKRYEFMTKYLPTVAKKPLIMMRETAGIQASFDYSSEEDAMKKFAFSLKLSPIVSAIFSNSPIRNGRLTKYKSNRALSWLDTDNARCGLVSQKVFLNNFTFQDYIQILLDVPMIFIERDINGIKTAIKIENLTFRQFLKQGYCGFNPIEQDWVTHLSLYFPDVRFKNYIEIRNHDNQRPDLICAIPALWKGLLYNDDAMIEVTNLLKNLTYFDIAYLRRKVPQTALNIKIKGHKLIDIAKEITNISYTSLKSYNNNENILLEPLMDLLIQGVTPADVIINKWQNEWNQDISKLIEYCKIA